MTGMRLETRISQELNMVPLDDVADIIDKLRGGIGLNFKKEKLFHYLENVNQLLETRDLHYISNLPRIYESDVDEIEAHYKIAALTHILSDSVLLIYINKTLTNAFEEIAKEELNVESPIELRFVKAKDRDKPRDYKSKPIDYPVEKINFKGGDPSLAKLQNEIRRLSRMLVKGEPPNMKINKDTYSPGRLLAFEGIYNFGIPVLGGKDKRELYTPVHEFLKKTIGEYCIEMPDFEN